MEMMLDKKQIQVIFLFECKMGHKTVETAHNINNIFGPGIANEHIVQWSLKFYKGNKSLYKRLYKRPLQRAFSSTEASHQKLTMTN